MCLIRLVRRVVFSVLSLFIFTANAFIAFSLGWGVIATMVWLVRIALVALKLLPIYEIFDLKYDVVAYTLSSLLCLYSWFAFRILKLMKTLFIVIGASVTLWTSSRHCATGQSLVQGLVPRFCELHFFHVLFNQVSY